MLALAFGITTQWREKGQGLPHGLVLFFFKQEKDLHVLYVLGASLFIYVLNSFINHCSWRGLCTLTSDKGREVYFVSELSKVVVYFNSGNWSFQCDTSRMQSFQPIRQQAAPWGSVYSI